MTHYSDLPVLEQVALLAQRRALLERHLRTGDLLTHTSVPYLQEEHVFTERNGIFLCGRATPETLRYRGMYDEPAEVCCNDISPLDVTHVNRLPVEQLHLAPR